MLMSRRPGNDSNQSNGHGRSALLADAKPTMSNLFCNATETMSSADLKKKFLDECKAEKLAYCIIVREMDNPSLSLLHQEDFSVLLASYGGAAGTSNDHFVYNIMQSQIAGFSGTALGAFGAAAGNGGLPASMVAPSLLFEELEVRGARGEPKRLALLPAPPPNAGAL